MAATATMRPPEAYGERSYQLWGDYILPRRWRPPCFSQTLLARRFPHGGAFNIRCPILNGTGLGPVAGGDLALPAGLVDDFDLPLLGTAGVSWPPA